MCSQFIGSRLADQQEPTRRQSITEKSNGLAGFFATFIATCEVETITTRTDWATNHIGYRSRMANRKPNIVAS